MQKSEQERIKTNITAHHEAFFNTVALASHQIIEADYTFIALMDEQTSCYKTVSFIAKGKAEDNIVYTLTDSPCAVATSNALCCYPEKVRSQFPKDKLLSDLKIEGYLASPIHYPDENIDALLVTLYEQPIENEKALKALFSHLTTIISSLLTLSHELSLKGAQLQLTQKQLIESKKMASLGGLIAGISHEVNTPLGIAITTHSIIADEHKQLSAKMANKQLSMKDMNQYLQAVSDAISMQGENLTRAKKLIENFKKTTVDQHQLDIEEINLKDYYQKVISTLTSILKTKKVSISLTGEENIILATYPGVHAQIITNLITNSVRHGFIDKNDNQIQINIQRTKDHVITVQYQDNGIGLSDEAKKHVFEAFFTTAKEQGGIGLGMSIVHDLLTEKLHGEINLETSTTGAKFIYHFSAYSNS